MKRLESIKNEVATEKNTPFYNGTGEIHFSLEDIDWLIEQAEKVEELQRQNTKLNKTIGEYSGRISALSDRMADLAQELFNA